MTDLALAHTATELFGALCERHGGAGALSVIDREIIAAMVKLFAAMRAAEAAELPKLVDGMARLEAMLPSPSHAPLSPLERLREHCAGLPTPGAPSLAGGLPAGVAGPS